ncbi:MAG TPA: ATP-binding protein [Candidatus Limnocylindrales bacterium]
MDATRSLRLAAASVADLAAVRRFVVDSVRSLGVEPGVEPDLVIALDEAVTNVLVHGYRGARGPVEIEVALRGGTVIVRVRDRAPAFDPTSWPTPDMTVPLERRRAGGFGIHLARTSMDEVTHRTLDGGNELTLIKDLTRGGRDER